MAGYDANFYDSSATDLGHTSAAAVAAEVSKYVTPKSFVDLGCGNGGWTKAFAALGIEDYLGIDGPWVQPEWLDIPVEHFRQDDLAVGSSIDREYDLAISVEVAEHLPESSADGFVETITRAAPVVVFSAAIPFQGGTGHLNEQWPSYWAKKFAARGYVAVDALRRPLWDREDIAYFYRQNITFYVKESELANYPKLAAAHEHLGGLVPDLVHPEVWERRSLQRVNVPRILGRERAERLRDTVNNTRRRLGR
ncbi:MAG: class I SAM-dependent methyltransferase [Solirubrobacteraceae bacterium]|nr:class I SAM-dependent methyltransferase [Solirubrobacteraceae bacterium]